MPNERRLDNWLTSYLQYTEESEPPTSYHKWVGIGLIASALQRKVKIKWGHERFFPNFYIVLVGPSGRCRKGLSMRMGRDILNQLPVTVISEKITLQGLIRDVAGASADFMDGGTPNFHSSVTIFSEELTVLLGKQDTEMLAALTDWFDSPNEWTYRTKQAGTDKVQGLCINVIGATAPDLLQVMLPPEAIGGGWSSRVIFVFADRKKQTVPDEIITPEKVELKSTLAKDLGKIHLMQGDVYFSNRAKALYTDWYLGEDREMQNGEYPINDHRFHYYCERRAMHVRKIATILHIARQHDLEVDEIDMEEAITLLTQTEKTMHRTFGGFGRSEHGDLISRITDLVRTKKRITRAEILKVCRFDMTSKEFDELKMSLIESGSVGEIYNSADHCATVYEWKEDD